MWPPGVFVLQRHSFKKFFSGWVIVAPEREYDHGQFDLAGRAWNTEVVKSNDGPVEMTSGQDGVQLGFWVDEDDPVSVFSAFLEGHRGGDLMVRN